MGSKKTMVILAGGLGSRYNGLKQVEGILENGAPLMEYSIFDAIEAGFNKIVVIINKMIPESYKQRLENILTKKNIELHFVYQNMEDFVPAGYDCSIRQKPWGTSHALLCAKNVVQEPFVVLNADDFYGKDAYRTAAKAIEEGRINPKQYQLVAYQLEPTLSKNGSVARGVCEVDADGNLVSVRERTAIEKDGEEIFFTDGDAKGTLQADTPVSMNFWIFDANIFPFLEAKFVEFVNAGPEPKTEYFIPTAVQQLIDEDRVSFKLQTSNGEWKGVTYAADKPMVQDFLKNEIAQNRYLPELWS